MQKKIQLLIFCFSLSVILFSCAEEIPEAPVTVEEGYMSATLGEEDVQLLITDFTRTKHGDTVNLVIYGEDTKGHKLTLRFKDVIGMSEKKYDIGIDKTNPITSIMASYIKKDSVTTEYLADFLTGSGSITIITFSDSVVKGTFDLKAGSLDDTTNTLIPLQGQFNLNTTSKPDNGGGDTSDSTKYIMSVKMTYYKDNHKVVRDTMVSYAALMPASKFNAIYANSSSDVDGSFKRYIYIPFYVETLDTGAVYNLVNENGNVVFEYIRQLNSSGQKEVYMADGKIGSGTINISKILSDRLVGDFDVICIWSADTVRIEGNFISKISSNSK